ncbi:hypothetical protein [Actinoplanes sp. HUAS TT8]|uniref:hypothetical protein n=1 Tax=Actinoplanes sp. HUAS TT8 TaxID=3447453 RepID=UPI003F521DE9
MKARHDLGKFITELPVAQRGVVLSSGREARSDLLIAQRGVMVSTRSVLSHRSGSVNRNNR